MGAHYILCVHTTNNKKKMYSLFTACKFSKQAKGTGWFQSKPLSLYPWSTGQLTSTKIRFPSPRDRWP